MQTIFQYLYRWRFYGIRLKHISDIIKATLSRSKWMVFTSAVLLIFLFLQIIFVQNHYSFLFKKNSDNALNLISIKNTSNIVVDQTISFRYDTDYNENVFVDELKLKLQKLPDCLIIGVRKGGTRALLDALSLHPSIEVARREVHFFDKLINYEQGTKWYRQQMPFTTKNQITIEKTPAYFVNPEVPFRIKQLNENMKIILIVRNPVVRLISDFTQVYHTKLERNKTQITFTDAIFLKNTTLLNRAYKPVRNSLYAEHFSKWLKIFPLKQFLILDGDKFIINPLEQLRLAENFLELPNLIRSDQLIFNKKKGFFCFRRENKRTARCLGETKGRAQIPVSKTIRKHLTKELRLENLKFFKQIQRNFSDWI